MLENKVFIALGSNVGDRLSYLKKALDKVSHIEGVGIMKTSSIMETSPVGVEAQASYFNQIILIGTSILPDELLAKFKNIEAQLGRKPRTKWAEREIDIDIIEYEGVQMESEKLNLPHKETLNRLFILKGCYEIMPDYMMRTYNSTIKTLYFKGLERLNDQIILDTNS